MKKVIALMFLVASVMLVGTPAWADMAEKFKKVKILDDIEVFLDVEKENGEEALDALEIKKQAIASFEKHMRGMTVNNDAYVDNYPAAGYEFENVGYIFIKIMSIRTKGGVNAYHLGFEFGVPPRQVYWDTATMGLSPTSMKMRKAIADDIDKVMKDLSVDFYQGR